mgnify:CR=1 FL=1
MKKLITLSALLCAMCVMFSCNDGSSQPPVFKAGDDLPRQFQNSSQVKHSLFPTMWILKLL